MDAGPPPHESRSDALKQVNRRNPSRPASPAIDNVGTGHGVFPAKRKPVRRGKRAEGNSAQALTVALGLTAIAAGLASIAAAPGVPGVLGAGLALIMLAIAVIDARHFIIPNGWLPPDLVSASFMPGSPAHRARSKG